MVNAGRMQSFGGFSRKDVWAVDGGLGRGK